MAFNAVDTVLAQFPWLSLLGDQIYQVLVDGVLANEPVEVVLQNIRNTDTYKTRFAGMLTRQQANLPAITEAEYLEIESGIRSQLREFNVLGTLGLTSEEKFRQFAAERIGADVGVAEINRRLDRAVAMARNLPDETQAAFQEWYGVQPSEDAMIAYFLEPDIGLSAIEEQMASAVIGGEALSRGLNITRTRAEILRREGVTADLARQGFADIAREQPVLSRLAQIHGVNPLSQEELEEFFFHEDPQVGSRRARVFSEALAEFQGGGPAQRSRSGGLEELVVRSRTV